MKARRDVKVEHLRQVSLFAGLADDALRRVVSAADEVAVPTGYVLVHDGHWSGEVFVIVSGTAEIVCDGAATFVVADGDLVDGLGAGGSPAAVATITAASSMRFLVFDQEGFASLLEEFPLLAQRVAAQRVTGPLDGVPKDGARRAGARRTRSGAANRQAVYPRLSV